MKETPTRVRRLPLRLAGVIGIASAILYLAGVAGADDDTYLVAAGFWFFVTVVAGMVAWFADRSEQYGRRMAIGATVAFLVLGVLSSATVFVVIYFVAMILCAAGFLGLESARRSIDD